MLKPDLTVAEMCEILEASPVGVPARAMGNAKFSFAWIPAKLRKTWCSGL